jgi:hypothetical protein
MLSRKISDRIVKSVLPLPFNPPLLRVERGMGRKREFCLGDLELVEGWSPDKITRESQPLPFCKPFPQNYQYTTNNHG